MDPYSGINFGGSERPAGMFFVDFGLGDTLGGLGPMVPFLAAGGVAKYLGGAKAFESMTTSAARRAASGASITTGYYARHTARQLRSANVGGMYQFTQGATYANPARARRLGRAYAVQGQAMALQRDIAAAGVSAGGEHAMSSLYHRARRKGYDLFSRYGMATGGRIAAAGVATNAFRFLEGIALLTLGMEAGRGLAQSIADWQPAQAQGPSVDFGDGGYSPSAAAAMTQRQRALSAIHNSQLGVRAALGNEANFLH